MDIRISKGNGGQSATVTPQVHYLPLKKNKKVKIRKTKELDIWGVSLGATACVVSSSTPILKAG